MEIQITPGISMIELYDLLVNDAKTRLPDATPQTLQRIIASAWTAILAEYGIAPVER